MTRGKSGGLDESTTVISEQVGALADDIAALDTQLGGVSALLIRYRDTARSAELLAADSRADLEASAQSTRLLLVLLGTVFALGQIVPIWLGSVLRGADGPSRSIIRRGGDDEPSGADPPLTSSPAAARSV